MSDPVDYAALAKQFGGTSTAPAAPKIDYAALAKQYGATSSKPVQKPMGAAPTPIEFDHTVLGDLGQNLGNLLAGGVRGAGSIGATIMYPYDKALDALNGDRKANVSSLITGQKPKTRNEERRADMDATLADFGAQPDSLPYKVGKLGGEIAGTAGAGGVLGNALRFGAPAAVAASPRLAQLAASLESGGFSLGAPAATTWGARAADLGIRAIGGAAAGAEQAAMVDPKDAKSGALLGAVLPVGAKVVSEGLGAAGRALRGSAVSPEVAQLADRAKQLGVDIPADRLVDSKPLNALAETLNYVPFSGRAGTEKKMVGQLNRALSRTFGQDSENVTMALRKASGDLGAKFDNVLQNNTVKMTPSFKTALDEAETQANSELGPEAASIIRNQIAQIQTKGAAGEIEGQTAYNIKKALDRIGNGASDAAFYARELKKKLMNALNESLGPQESESFGKLRQQYGNMLDLEGLASNGAEGGVSVGKLANLKNINNPDLQELADIAAQFVKKRESQHGAMQRAVAGATGVGMSVTGGLAPAAAIGGGAIVGRGLNMLLNSNVAKRAILNQGPSQLGQNVNQLMTYAPRVAVPMTGQ